MCKNSQYSKKELEDLIAKEWTLGTYVFDEEKQIFFGDMDIEIYIRKIEKDVYQSCEYIYYDGYESGVSEEEIKSLIFTGDKYSVAKQVLETFNSNDTHFMEYPIIETNISIVFEIEEDQAIRYLPNGEFKTI